VTDQLQSAVRWLRASYIAGAVLGVVLIGLLGFSYWKATTAED